MAEYRTHSFNKEWHEKVERFIEENDLAFDSPKYFIKFCVNRYMDEYSDGASEADVEAVKAKMEELKESIGPEIWEDSE